MRLQLVTKDKDTHSNKILLSIKILSVILFVLGVFHNFLNDNFIWVINGGTYSEVYYHNTDILQSLLRWGLVLGIVICPVAAFFKTRVIKNFVIYFCAPIAILCFVFYGDFLNYFTTDSGRAIFAPSYIRHIEFSLILVLIITIALLLRFGTKHKFNVQDKKEWINFFCLLPLILLLVMPVYLPQSLFGFTNIFMTPFSLPNIIWMVAIVALLIALYFIYRFKDKQTRTMICILLALYLFYHYNSIYLMDLLMSRLPFQLCNLGAYLIIVALICRKQWFFNFVLLANVPGALIAVCVPDVSQGILSFWNIHFYIEHTWVFIIPLLAVALRVMERPKLSAIKSFVIGFSIYFIFCVTSGLIANAFLYDPNVMFFNKVNYFYLFDTTVLKVMSFLNFSHVVSLTLNGYVFYPMYMLTIYILYMAYCMGFLYVYKQFIKIGDDHFKLRQIRIDLMTEKGKYKNKKIPQKTYNEEGEQLC